MFISTFCKICELNTKHEIVFVWFLQSFRFTNGFAKANKRITLENLKKIQGFVSYLSSCIRISLFKEEGLAFYAPKFRANCPHGNPVPPALSRRSAQLWLAASKLRYVVTNRNTNLNWAHIPLGHTNVSMVVTLYLCHSILLDNRNHKKFLWIQMRCL